MPSNNKLSDTEINVRLQMPAARRSHISLGALIQTGTRKGELSTLTLNDASPKPTVQNGDGTGALYLVSSARAEGTMPRLSGGSPGPRSGKFG